MNIINEYTPAQRQEIKLYLQTRLKNATRPQVRARLERAIKIVEAAK
jgi:hypothetical protein